MSIATDWNYQKRREEKGPLPSCSFVICNQRLRSHLLQHIPVTFTTTIQLRSLTGSFTHLLLGMIVCDLLNSQLQQTNKRLVEKLRSSVHFTHKHSELTTIAIICRRSTFSLCRRSPLYLASANQSRTFVIIALTFLINYSDQSSKPSHQQ